MNHGSLFSGIGLPFAMSEFDHPFILENGSKTLDEIILVNTF